MTEDDEELASWEEWTERLGKYFDMDGNEITLREWGDMYNHPERRIVKQDHVGRYFVSTVLLGVDHSFTPEGPPILFETMIFDNKGVQGQGLGEDVFCDRYTNKDAALAGHDQAVERARRKDFS